MCVIVHECVLRQVGGGGRSVKEKIREKAGFLLDVCQNHKFASLFPPVYFCALKV